MALGRNQSPSVAVMHLAILSLLKEIGTMNNILVED